MIGIAKNRQVSIKKGEYQWVESLDIEGLGQSFTWKILGKWKYLRNISKTGWFVFIFYFAKIRKTLEEVDKTQFIGLKTIHWGIECYHRALKQLCGINKFIVRKSEGILNHFFSSLRAFIKLELMRYKELIDNWYQLQREISLQVNRHFIWEHLS